MLRPHFFPAWRSSEVFRLDPRQPSDSVLTASTGLHEDKNIAIKRRAFTNSSQLSRKIESRKRNSKAWPQSC